MACYLLCEGLMLCRGAIYLSTDYSFASLCIMYVWLNLLRRVLRLKWLHALMFPLLNTASRPLSTCFRSNYFDFVFPCIRFRFPDRALPFPYPLPHKNMKTKVVRVFSRSFPTAFIPTSKSTNGPCSRPLLLSKGPLNYFGLSNFLSTPRIVSILQPLHS